MYDNKFPLKEFAGLLISAFLLCVLYEFEYYLLDVFYFEQEYVFQFKSLKLFIISFVSIILCSFISSTFQYRIVDNQLICKEKILFIDVIDISIPLTNISKVELTRDWNHWYKHLVLFVGSNKYHLSAITYKQELYNDLKKLIGSTDKQYSEIKFYKQSK